MWLLFSREASSPFFRGDDKVAQKPKSEGRDAFCDRVLYIHRPSTHNPINYVSQKYGYRLLRLSLCLMRP